MTYYIYHIPGKKIGVTRDLNRRVTIFQGYKPDEYEVLDSSDDIDYISKKEIELQKSYGYKKDNTIYSKLGKLTKMKVSSTDVSTTFSCPINKLKGNLMDMKGEKFSNLDGEYLLNDNLINYILKHVHPSMYNDTTCFVYNKKLSTFLNEWVEEPKSVKVEGDSIYLTTFDKIRDWAKERGLYDKGDTKTQYLKLMEEAGELGRAILKDDQPEFVDAIGDMVVVLTNLAELGNTSIEECTSSAYNVIAKRTGEMVNGTFVKDDK